MKHALPLLTALLLASQFVARADDELVVYPQVAEGKPTGH
jgi:hypothetical protein